jgi:hypothetical protein
LNPADAAINRDAIAKTIFHGLSNCVVHRANEQMLPREEVLSESEMESDEDSDSIEDDTYQVSWNGCIR